jgi:hypothetical protein
MQVERVELLVEVLLCVTPVIEIRIGREEL